MEPVKRMGWILLLGTGAAWAVSGAAPARSKGVEACRKDIAKFCKVIKPGEGRLGDCLYAHFKALSPACRRFARHGGPGHELESLRDLDKTLAAPPAK